MRFLEAEAANSIGININSELFAHCLNMPFGLKDSENEISRLMSKSSAYIPAPLFTASKALQSCSMCAGTLRIGLPRYIASQMDSKPAVLAYALQAAI